MRNLLWMSVVVAASVAVPTAQMQAQADGQAAGQAGQQPGQMRGQGQGGRGGFFVGQPVQGTVTAATASKLTIQTAAGDSYDVIVTDTTRIMENRQAVKLTDIKPGDSVTAMGQVDATKKTVAAMMVNAVDAATVATFPGTNNKWNAFQTTPGLGFAVKGNN